jgi:hypothetical protein
VTAAHEDGGTQGGQKKEDVELVGIFLPRLEVSVGEARHGGGCREEKARVENRKAIQDEESRYSVGRPDGYQPKAKESECEPGESQPERDTVVPAASDREHNRNRRHSDDDDRQKDEQINLIHAFPSSSLWLNRVGRGVKARIGPSRATWLSPRARAARLRTQRSGGEIPAPDPLCSESAAGKRPATG